MPISKRPHWRCVKCGIVFEKEDFASRLVIYEEMEKHGARAVVMGSRTCPKCGTAHQMGDIYIGKYDVLEDSSPTSERSMNREETRRRPDVKWRAKPSTLGDVLRSLIVGPLFGWITMLMLL